MIGHGHDGAGGSLNRACHGTGKLAELDTARTVSGGDVGWSFVKRVPGWIDRHLIRSRSLDQMSISSSTKTCRVLSYKKSENS